MMTIVLCFTMAGTPVFAAEDTGGGMPASESGTDSGGVPGDDAGTDKDANTDTDTDKGTGTGVDTGTDKDTNTNAGNEADREKTDSMDNGIPDADSDMREETDGQDVSLLSASNDSAAMPTDGNVLIKLASDTKWIWNMNGAGTWQNDCVHLDDNTGLNCTMRLNREITDNGTQYYSIRYSESAWYIDSEKDDDKTGRVLHNGEKKRNQDNQLFRFVQVKDSSGKIKKDTYYILSKKGDNKGKSLYIGLEDDKSAAEGRKVATTSKPTEWVIHSMLIDEDVDSAAGLKGDNGNAFCMIYPKGYKRGITIQGDGAAVGEDLQLWLHGTSAKIELEWNGVYRAYKIRSRTLGEFPTVAGSDFVWDVEGRSFNEGAQAHIWYNDDDTPSQYWRFLKNNDGTYRIQNAYTGKYMAVEGAGGGAVRDFDGSNVVMSKEPADWHVDILNNKSQNVDGTTWMSHIPGSQRLSQINIPGTHDTGTAFTPFGESEQTSMAKCQQLYIDEQLNVGVRAFDLRCSPVFWPDDPEIVHGSDFAVCMDRSGYTLNLSEVFQTTAEFLRAHNTETVIINVKKDGGGDSWKVAQAIDSYIKDNRYPIYVPNSWEVPKLEDVRGKIVLMRRYDFEDYSIQSSQFGFGYDLTKWDDIDYANIPGAKAIENSGGKVWAQDAYKLPVQDKRSHIKEAIEQANNGTIPGNSYLYNYASGTNPAIVLNYTRQINDWLLSQEMRAYMEDKRVGIFMMNYVDANLARLIYENNPLKEQVSFPTSATMTYGQTLSEAVLEGESGDGSFTFENPQERPAAAGTYEYTLIYTPADSSPEQRQKVKVTVKEKELHAKANTRTTEFGETYKEEDCYTISKEELVNGDSAKSVKISVDIKDEHNASDLKEGDLFSVGKYSFHLKDEDSRYKIIFDKDNGTITVDKRLAKITWTGKHVYYVGDEVELVPTVSNALDGYPCTIPEENIMDSGTDTPSYDQETGEWTLSSVLVSGLSDEEHYRLVTNAPGVYPNSNNWKEYLVYERDGEVKFPEEVTITYGETLADAKFDEADGATGKYTFAPADKDRHLTVADSGGKYKMYYYSDDIQAQPHSQAEVTVRVLPRPITVQSKIAVGGEPAAESGEIEYGEAIGADIYSAGLDTGSTLAFDDEMTDLGLKVGALTAEGTPVQAGTPAGDYQVVETECTNDNYEVSVRPATLTISRREAELEWNYSPQGPPLYYDGNPKDVTATVKNLYSNGLGVRDDCTVFVAGGNKTKAGTYKAFAVALQGKDARNYKLPLPGSPNYQNMVCPYTIQKCRPHITWPDVSAVYGETLMEAHFSGQSAEDGSGNKVEGTFAFAQEELLKMPQVSESGRTKYKMVFTPTDKKNYETVEGETTVTVSAKQIYAYANETEKIYGDDTKLTFSLDEAQLADGDTKDGLGITLEAVKQDDESVSGEQKNSPAGTYTIRMKDWTDKNYEVSMSESTLTILKRKVQIRWSDVSNLVYGQPDEPTWNSKGADVTATVDNLLTVNGKADDCGIAVTGGRETQASFQGPGGGYTVYHAVAAELTGADKDNYDFEEGLPEPPWDDDRDNTRHCPYVIRRAADEDYIYPQAAVLTYGQQLSDAQMLAGSGDGSFILVGEHGVKLSDEKLAEVLDGGIHEGYYVRFKPKNQNEYAAGKQEIPVIVRKRAVTVTADDKAKLYGVKEPDYSVTLSDETPLADKDKGKELMDVLDLTLEPVRIVDNGDGTQACYMGNTVDSEVGMYIIRKNEKDSVSNNYKVTVLEGNLLIKPKMVKPQWMYQTWSTAESQSR